jgi:exodeoxyribonuclease III
MMVPYAIHLAPLQGYTDLVYREAHARVFGGVDTYYTPFVRLEKDGFRNKELRDLAPEANASASLVPQMIAASPEEFRRIAGLFRESGYRRADINLGCPFPMQVRQHRGAGILPYPDEVKVLLETIFEFPEIQFSVKLRLGWDSPEEAQALLPFLNGLPEWLAQEQPDVLCLQETKLQPDQYPAEAFEALGYKAWLFSAQKKGYSGVAILSRREPDHVEYGMGIEKYDNEGRFIRADFGDLSVISVYHPSGTSGDERQAFKMEWLEDFQNYVVELQKSRPKLILCGDYNICHEPIDIHDPVRNATNSGFLPEEREWMTRFLDAGYIDTFRLLNPDKQEYTWWSYRFSARAKNKGWRIDYCMVSEPMKAQVEKAYILNEAVHSDHCPAVIEVS